LNHSKSCLSAHGSRHANVHPIIEEFLLAGDDGHAGSHIRPKRKPFQEQDAFQDQPDNMPLYASVCLDDPYAVPNDDEGKDDLASLLA
jgi:hypothetical protein